jgi:GGDEF domain-containing protein
MTENKNPQNTLAESQNDWQDLVLPRDVWRQKAEKEFQEARAKDEPLSAVFVDLNYFKSINDMLGHKVGDEVIGDMRDLMSILVHSFRVVNQPGQERQLDIVAASQASPPQVNGEPVAGHIGGDEFAIVAKTDAAGVRAIVERLRSIFQDYINNPAKEERARLRELDIDMAIGTATLTPEMEQLSDLLAAADASMYEDKLSRLELDEHQRHAIRLAGKILKAADVRVRDIPKIIRMHPELFDDSGLNEQA